MKVLTYDETVETVLNHCKAKRGYWFINADGMIRRPLGLWLKSELSHAEGWPTSRKVACPVSSIGEAESSFLDDVTRDYYLDPSAVDDLAYAADHAQGWSPEGDKPLIAKIIHACFVREW